MKQNKDTQTSPIESLPGYTVDETLDPGMAELTTYIPGQAEPLIVRGDAELLREDFRRQAVTEAAQATRKARTDKLAGKTIKAAQTAPEAPTGPMYIEPTTRDKVRQYFADSHVRRFDREHGTDLYAELQRQRRAEAILLKATELHLFDPRSDSYKAQLNRLAKKRAA